MKKLTYFYLQNCPHCKRAWAYLEELLEANADFREIEITQIEERRHPEIADKYDYYYVPTFFMGEEKLAEGVLSKEDVKKVLETALS